MKLFTNDPEVIAVGSPMLKVFVIATVLLGVLFGLTSVFSGSG